MTLRTNITLCVVFLMGLGGPAAHGGSARRPAASPPAAGPAAADSPPAIPAVTSAVCQDPVLQGSCARLGNFAALAVSLAARGDKDAALAAQAQCREFLTEHKTLVEQAQGLSRSPSGAGAEGLSSGQMTTLGPQLESSEAFCRALTQPGSSLTTDICSGVVPLGDGISYGLALERAFAALGITMRPCVKEPAESHPAVPEDRPPAERVAVVPTSQPGPGAAAAAVPSLSRQAQPPVPALQVVTKESAPWRRPARIAIATGLGVIAVGLLIAGGRDLAQGHGLEHDSWAAQSQLTPRQFENQQSTYRAAYLKGGLETGFAGLALAGVGLTLGVYGTKAF